MSVLLSSKFNSHFSFDHQFDAFVTEFINEALLKVKHFQRIAVLDDGGHLIRSLVKKMKGISEKFVAVEQTASGYEALKALNLNFPVVNVAKSSAKLIYEYPMVADIVMQRIMERLRALQSHPKTILIIGMGVLRSGTSFRIKRFL